jgi:hypothetical protein
MKFTFLVFLLATTVSLVTAGEPEPIIFDSISYGLTLAEPYGQSLLTVECAKDSAGDFRIIKLVKLVTKKGTIVAPAKFTEKVRDAYKVEVSSIEKNAGMGEFSVRITYDLANRYSKKKTFVAFEFTMGKFVQYR